MISSTGEIIMRLSTANDLRLTQAGTLDVNYGGSEMNVLIGLSLMGHQTRFLSRIPENPLGIAAGRKLNAFGIDSSFIFHGSERMPLYYLEPAAGIRGGNITYDRKQGSFNYLKPDEIDWNRFYEGVQWFHWSGITPGLSEAALSLCQVCINEASARDINVSCDLHFRKNLWDFGVHPRDVIPDMLSKTDYLAGNPSGVMQMAGMENIPSGQLSDKQIFNAFGQIRNTFPNIKTLAMLSRNIKSASNQELRGLMYSDEAYQAESVRIEQVTDRIGGGDAFMAGLIHGWKSGMQPAETINYATIVAAYKHTITGDHLEGSISDFLSIKNKGEINR
jgi:2-dehydro-3-deoxygluconokinase